MNLQSFIFTRVRIKMNFSTKQKNSAIASLAIFMLTMPVADGGPLAAIAIIPCLAACTAAFAASTGGFGAFAGWFACKTACTAAAVAAGIAPTP
jgi:hypothetical protein